MSLTSHCSINRFYTRFFKAEKEEATTAFTAQARVRARLDATRLAVGDNCENLADLHGRGAIRIESSANPFGERTARHSARVSDPLATVQPKANSKQNRVF